jgi:quinol monooxygenase YgiN
MFTRVVEIRTKTGKFRDFSASLNDEVLPLLRKQPGFIDEITLISNTEPDHILALSFWHSEADAERYNREQFPTVTELISPLLETKPNVKTYNVDTSTTHNITKGKAA